MKKFISILFAYLIFLPVLCLANEVNIFASQLQDKDNIYIKIDVKLPDNSYTYSPDYNAYPTKLTLNTTNSKQNNKEILLYYPITENTFDPLTQSELPLYKDKIEFIIKLSKELYNFNEYNHVFISFLLCTETNCTPYKKEIKIEKINTANNLQFLDIANYNTKHYKTKNIDLQSISVKDSSLVSSENFTFITQEYPNSIEVVNYSLAILLGFLAGIILNFMPCVLPVIAIKFASILQAVNNNLEEKFSIIKSYSIFYSLGIISFFTILAILVGVFDMIWGQIFQNVYFIILLIGLLFMFALSLLGFFYFPLFSINIKAKKYPRLESFIQGVFATLVATPCSGPLLGGVLAFSLTLPLHFLITVFIATGLGMAFPYILLFIFPNFIKFIPKSGNWTKILEKILAYIFLITCLYLLSLLPNTLLYKAIVYIFFVYFFISIYNIVAKSKRHILYAIIIFCIHSLCSYTLLQYNNKEINMWESYSYESFNNYLGEEILIVNFTANWCPTCKIIENTSLKNSNINNLVEKYDAKLIEVDMTEENIQNSQLLKSLNSRSIPLLAIFPIGIEAYSPILLRDLFSYKQLENAVKNIVK